MWAMAGLNPHYDDIITAGMAAFVVFVVTGFLNWLKGELKAKFAADREARAQEVAWRSEVVNGIGANRKSMKDLHECMDRRMTELEEETKRRQKLGEEFLRSNEAGHMAIINKQDEEVEIRKYNGDRLTKLEEALGMQK